MSRTTPVLFGADGVVTRKKACEMMGISKATLDRRIAAGRIKAKKDGNRTIIDRASVLLYLENLPSVAEVG